MSMLKRFFDRTDAPVGRVSDWSSVLSILAATGFFSWLCGFFEPVARYGWAGIILFSIMFACIFCSASALILIAWRKFRPLPEDYLLQHSKFSEILNEKIHAMLQHEFSNIRKDVNDTSKMVANLYEVRRSGTNLDNKRITSMLDRLANIEDVLQPEQQAVSLLAKLGRPEEPTPKNRFDSMQLSINRLKDDVEDNFEILRNSISDLREKISETTDDLGSFVDRVRSTLYAERTLEAFKEMDSAIKNIIMDLKDPASRLESDGNLNEWTAQYNELESRIRGICRFVKPYKDVESDIFDFSPELFKSQNWSYNFRNLSDDQKHDYKTYRIIAHNYEHASSSVLSHLIDATHAIFNAPKSGRY
ncbi:hypothetical protein [Methylobacterium sp. ID0610]|uniref:hypothetical protein n=1 Tax=Methylobacterium carpenticola TaxID=3344827 RepID=UPI0036BB4F18